MPINSFLQTDDDTPITERDYKSMIQQHANKKRRVVKREKVCEIVQAFYSRYLHRRGKWLQEIHLLFNQFMLHILQILMNSPKSTLFRLLNDLRLSIAVHCSLSLISIRTANLEIYEEDTDGKSEVFKVQPSRYLFPVLSGRSANNYIDVDNRGYTFFDGATGKSENTLTVLNLLQDFMMMVENLKKEFQQENGNKRKNFNCHLQ